MAFLRNDYRQPGKSLRYDHRGGLAGGCSAVGSGESGCGVVFELTPNGESVLWTFTGGADGSYPYGPVVMDTQGNLYGAATYGGDLNSTNPACAPSGTQSAAEPSSSSRPNNPQNERCRDARPGIVSYQQQKKSLAELRCESYESFVTRS